MSTNIGTPLSPEEKLKRDNFLNVLSSPEEMRDWIRAYLNIDLPYDTVDPDSNSNPIMAMWTVYDAVKHNRGDDIPGYIWLSAREAYKCVEKGTLIKTPTGLKKIEDLNVGDTVWSRSGYKKIDNHIDDGIKDGVRLTLKNGLSLTTSPIHRVWAWKYGKQKPDWCLVSGLTEKDIVLNDGEAQPIDTNNKDFEEGYLIGLLTGDGCLSLMDKYGLISLSTADEYIRDFWIKKCKELAGREPKFDKRCTYSVCSKGMVAKIKSLGLTNSYSYEKKIPYSCLSNTEKFLGFFSGIMDTDGSVDKRGKIVLSITAIDILFDLQKGLASLGVYSSVRVNKRKYGIQKHTIGTLTIGSCETHKLDSLGFKFKAKKKNIDKDPDQVNVFDSIPVAMISDFLISLPKKLTLRNREVLKPKAVLKYKTISRIKLLKLVEWAKESGHPIPSHIEESFSKRWVPVLSVEKVKDVHFYDLTVDGDPSYWSNGMMSHNTLGASLLEILIIFHFQLSIAHMAAIKSQSNKAISYISSFLARLKPYIDHNQWVRISDSNTKIQFRTPQGNTPYIVVIIATLTGANCVSPDTMVWTKDDKLVRAAELKPGDEIKTWDYLNGKDVYVKVSNILFTKKHARKISFDNSSNVIISDDHHVLTQKGWIAASQVRLGDRFKSTKQDLPLKSWVPVYDHQNSRTSDQLILGTLLGDASIQELPSGSCRYQVYHCDAQSEYIYLIKKVLESGGYSCTITKDGDGLKLTSRVDERLKEYRSLAYKNGKKIVTSEWLDKIKPEGLAYWLMDDARGNPKEVGSTKERSFEIATCGFSKEESELVRVWLSSKGYESKVKTVSNQSKKVWPMIVLNLDSSRRLSELTSPYFIPSMRYKLLSSKAEATTRRTIDTGEWVYGNQITKGFVWSDKKLRNLKAGRILGRKINKKLDVRVTKIELVGLQGLIDVVVDTEDKTLRSFYANNVLVHNSEHVPIMFIDEVDVVRDPVAYEEAKLIPGMERGNFPITVKLSTRKFAFGLMQKELDAVGTSGEQVLRWNILDVTEKCPTSRHQPAADGSRVELYVPKKLPMRAIDETAFAEIPDSQRGDWEHVKVHPGCASCTLVTVCKSRLADKPEGAKFSKASLYKPIKSVINSFRKLSPDMGEAQLLCWKPSTKGLVYPRFEPTIGGNMMTMERAYELITGDKRDKCDMTEIIEALHKYEAKIYGGVDWGFAHESTAVILAVIPSGQSLVLETYGMPGLEAHEFVEELIKFQIKYKVEKWFCDPAAPANIKTFKRVGRDHGVRCPEFKKDVMGGIEAVRSQIVNATGTRRFYVLETPENEKLKQGFKVHHFKLDAQGNITKEPDDESYADVMDAVRYIGQNVYGIPGSKPLAALAEDANKKRIDHKSTLEEMRQVASTINNDLMKNEIATRLIGASAPLTGGADNQSERKKKGKISWNF